MYLIVKRLFDVLLAIILMIVIMPVYILIGIIIYLQDGGSPIFKQIRVGEKGETFQFFKFRSMPLNSPNVGSHEKEKLKITPFGTFIRRTNLDELPQFYNVLKGDMSFIGPRPCIPNQTYLVKLRYENGSFNCKPGLTGWAQVNSFDGMTEIEKAKFDQEYIENLSFKRDFLILLKTVVYFTKKPPVY